MSGSTEMISEKDQHDYVSDIEHALNDYKERLNDALKVCDEVRSKLSKAESVIREAHEHLVKWSISEEDDIPDVCAARDILYEACKHAIQE